MHAIEKVKDFNFKECYKLYRNEIQTMFTSLHKQKNAVLEAYCDLLDNKWDEEKLGEYRGDAFALTLYYFIMYAVSPYDLHLYSMTTRESKSEEEVKDFFLRLVYSAWWRETSLKGIDSAIVEVENEIISRS